MTKQTHTNAGLMARRHAIIARGIGNAHPVFAAKASNSEIWDVEGKRYIDFCAGIAVVNTGHCHPKVVEAIAAQVPQFTHTCFQVVAYESYVELAERICKLAPGSHAKKAFFMSTGAEAIENAIKLARAFTGRSAIIAFNGAFHGRTMYSLALTGKVDPYKTGFGPFPGEIYHAAYPSAVHGVSVDDAIASIEKLFKNDVEPARVAAIFVEPVQGEGGYIPAPPEFLQRLRALCDKYGMLLVADEIQTGVARTGKLFAVEHAGIVPDLMTMAKGLGGGMPISAVVGRADIMDHSNPGGFGSTYAGNPLACAAALAVLDVVEQEQLCLRSQKIGERLRSFFGDLAKKNACIGDVRGLGAMTAVEFFHDGDSTRPAPEIANALKAEALKRGLLLLTCGNNGNVLRVMTPLTIPFDVLDEGLGIIAAIIDELAAQGQA
ncbi:MAG TPA: 4-aminobutyrate--2-oxoglutarate transaminase [Noviherbaspirillum sp.]|uniref:4-aminobutyrate--2-oxoglutarate transaminase n=1 Tax=Noviherbaspirillum sp. TaxID=1926288 RepID=UPI002B4745F1|nr:4-aminobutyrate--2-oxoglutarate transaminase [Noviherbaspirillum sp.]HJV84085.1 4-aminobutyrate--2-oxoglutarate transaminase [Noviherbaspirillum sp.]